MSSQIDLTFYNQVKASYQVAKGTIVLIPITSQNVGDLVPQVFQNADDFQAPMMRLANNNKAYACFSYLHEEPTFLLWSETFAQEECLVTGKVLYFEMDPFPKPIDMEKVREELRALGELLRNSKAS